MAVMAHLSVIGEAIRRTDHKALLKAAAHTFCWMCSYVAKCNESVDSVFHIKNDLSRLISLKFPNICGHCRQPRCVCDAVDMDQQEDKAAKYDELLYHEKHMKWSAYSVGDWLKTFWNIYSGRIHLQTMESLGFHLLEEAGEEAKAVRQLVQFSGIMKADVEGVDQEFLDRLSDIHTLVPEYRKCIDGLKDKYKVKTQKELKNLISPDSEESQVNRARLVMAKMDFVIELADTFSWLCAVLLKRLENVHRNNPDDIDNNRIEVELQALYSFDMTEKIGRCYACEQPQCKCVFFPQTSK